MDTKSRKKQANEKRYYIIKDKEEKREVVMNKGKTKATVITIVVLILLAILSFFAYKTFSRDVVVDKQQTAKSKDSQKKTKDDKKEKKNKTIKIENKTLETKDIERTDINKDPISQEVEGNRVTISDVKLADLKDAVKIQANDKNATKSVITFKMVFTAGIDSDLMLNDSQVVLANGEVTKVIVTNNAQLDNIPAGESRTIKIAIPVTSTNDLSTIPDLTYSFEAIGSLTNRQTRGLTAQFNIQVPLQ